MKQSEKFDKDFDWQRGLLPEVKKACAAHIISEASPEEDMKHNTDLIVLNMSSIRISVRLRRNHYLTRAAYAEEFTIRCERPTTGAQTELAKVISGWGDYMFYGFASADEKNLAAWVLGDLSVFRLWFNYQIIKNKGRLPGQLINNHDQSSNFRAFRITDLPSNFVVARVTPDMNDIARRSLDDSRAIETYAKTQSPSTYEQCELWALPTAVR